MTTSYPSWVKTEADKKRYNDALSRRKANEAKMPGIYGKAAAENAVKAGTGARVTPPPPGPSAPTVATRVDPEEQYRKSKILVAGGDTTRSAGGFSTGYDRTMQTALKRYGSHIGQQLSGPARMLSSPFANATILNRIAAPLTLESAKLPSKTVTMPASLISKPIPRASFVPSSYSIIAQRLAAQNLNNKK